MASRRLFIRRVVGAGAAAAAGGALSARVAATQSTGRITGFDHVALPMRNTDAMVVFYRALGFEVNEGESICSVHVGDHKINFHRPSLWQRKTFSLRAPGAVPPCGDFCFVWDGTLSTLQTMLNNAGAAVIEGPAERQGGRHGGQATGTSLYVRDPDQNLVEFIVYT